MDSSAVMGAEISDRTKESLNAFKPLYLVKTWVNHLKVSGLNL